MVLVFEIDCLYLYVFTYMCVTESSDEFYCHSIGTIFVLERGKLSKIIIQNVKSLTHHDASFLIAQICNRNIKPHLFSTCVIISCCSILPL